MISTSEAWAWVVAACGKASQIVAGAGALGTFYLACGGPVPATRDYVDSAVRPLRIETLSTQRSVLQINGYFLASEEAGMRKAAESLPEGSTTRAAIERRLLDLGELQAGVKRADEKARAKLDELDPRP